MNRLFKMKNFFKGTKSYRQSAQSDLCFWNLHNEIQSRLATKKIFKENKWNWRTTLYSNVLLWTISSWAAAVRFAVVRSLQKHFIGFSIQVVDKKRLENVTDPECHSKLPWPEEITAEGKRYKVKHWCLRIADIH